MKKSLLGRQMIDYKCLSTAGELDPFPLDCCNSLMVGTKKMVPQMCCLNDKLKWQQRRRLLKESKSRVELPINKDKDRQLSKQLRFSTPSPRDVECPGKRRCSFPKKAGRGKCWDDSNLWWKKCQEDSAENDIFHNLDISVVHML